MSDIVRKLASIRKIEEIKAIEGADRICAYRILGWWVVDQVGKYEVGDLVVYAEVDAFIPNSLAPFLTKPDRSPKEYNGVKGERLKTVKLRGALSQGLLLPLDHLDDGTPFISGHFHEDGVGSMVLVSEGDDVTELLGIQKWEAPIPAQLAGFVRGNFPSCVPKTDQERVQNCWRNVERVKTERFEVTQKLDGSSMTVLYTRHEEYGEDFQVCSRNLSLKEDENNTFWKVALKYDLATKMSALGRNIAIQGELMGPGIQGNSEKLNGFELFVFDIYDIDKGEYLKSQERLEICSNLGLKHCPILYNDLDIYEATVDSLLTLAEGCSLISANPVREGIVLKSLDSQFSFKAISNAYLLGEK